MSFDALLQFGWNQHFAAHFQPFLAKHYLPGRVSFQNQHLYRVYTAQGELLAEAAGKLRYEAESAEDLPAVGDWVALRYRAQSDRASIQAVLPRQSKFARKTAGAKTEAQIVGANVDTIFLVTSLNQDFNPRRIERYLTTLWDSGARPVIVLSKADLCQDEAALQAHLQTLQSVTADVPVHVVSAKAKQGLEPLLQYCTTGQTIALIGTSGAGKSTLINHLLGYERQQVKEIREHDDRGQHTTRHRELILLPQGGLVLDTPGMRELQLWEVEAGIETTFEDVEALAAQCFFSDCQHQSEPRCAVRAALEAGTLSAERLENYYKLQQEARHLTLRQDDLARRQEQKKWKKLTKLAEERARAKRKGS
ncbi:MAG TPA: ribosome small subunit-dependent GTPase A [Blastocatellia bacterium]|nr:ribosome small subunit-dependent GTPase A [Blastocatellia bacterium]